MKGWEMVQLRNVVTPADRAVTPQPGNPYRQLGVKLWGEGAYERETIDGSQTKYAKLYQAEAGDIVVNKIWARNGSVAVVNESLAGSYGSGEFPMFAPNRDALDPAWMHWLTKTPSFWFQCDEKSRGTSGKNRIKPEQFLSVEIPLPPLAEQRRIVARIEALAAEIAEAKRIRQQAVEEAEALAPLTLSSLLDDADWPRCALNDVLREKPRNGLGPQPEVDSGGRPMLRINAVSSTPTKYVDTTAFKTVAVSQEVAAPFVVRDGDVFIVRYKGDINRVAKPAIFRGDNTEGAVFPDKLIRLRADPEKIEPEFLVTTLNSRTVREQVEELGKTTAGNIGVSGGDAKAFQIPLPPLPEQRRIVAELDALQAQVDGLKRLQSETAAELDALVPAILDRAFKGGL